MDERVLALESVSCSGGVHFTQIGYRNWAADISDAMRHVATKLNAKKTLAADYVVTGRSFYWRGFHSPVGTPRQLPSRQPQQHGGPGSLRRGSSHRLSSIQTGGGEAEPTSSHHQSLHN